MNKRGMRVEHRFLQADRADAERIAHDDHGEFGQHDEEAAPRRGAADGRDGAIDAVGDALEPCFSWLARDVL